MPTILLPKVRLINPHLFEKVAADKDKQDGPKCYRFFAMLEKSDEQIKDLRKACFKLAKEKFPDEKESELKAWVAGKPCTLTTRQQNKFNPLPIYDGDENADKYAYQKGHFNIKVQNKDNKNGPAKKATIVKRVGEDFQDIIDPSELYSGCYVSVQINFYAYAYKSHGIAFGVDAVLKVAEGEKVGGGTVDAKSVFASVPTDTKEDYDSFEDAVASDDDDDFFDE